MGDVYLAEDGKLDRKVALKVLPEAMSADPERRARFEREAKAIAGADAPPTSSRSTPSRSRRARSS